MRTGAKSLENRAFSGFSHLPLSSVKFRQVRFLPLDSKCVCLNRHESSNLSVSARKKVGIPARVSTFFHLPAGNAFCHNFEQSLLNVEKFQKIRYTIYCNIVFFSIFNENTRLSKRKI